MKYETPQSLVQRKLWCHPRMKEKSFTSNLFKLHLSYKMS
jgi:hypothetical protein